MLFALDWIKRTWDAIVSAIQTFTEGLDMFTVSAAISGFWPVLAVCLVVGLILCLLGFRYHKFVHGILGGIFLGGLGWHIGQIINASQVSVSAIYAAILALAGFFVLYLCYFLSVFIGGSLLFLAVPAPLREALQGYAPLIAALLAVIYCTLYIEYKLSMTAVTGAVILGLLAFNSSPAIAAVIFSACTPAGIYVQIILRGRYERQKELSMKEQLEKYPYGPGLVYGWEDPTLSHTSKKKG